MGERQRGPDSVTVHRFAHTPVSVIVDPGSPPYTTPWDLELHGSLDTAVLHSLLDEHLPTEGRQLFRHGPEHHTLRFTQSREAPAAAVTGRIADRLTEPSEAAARPLTPAQRTALARHTGHGYEAVLLDMAPVPAADALRAAVCVVVAAHPQLRGRLNTTDGWLVDEPGQGAALQQVVAEGEFSDEAGFDALLEATARTLDEYAGVQLRVLLARDRRRAGQRADRIAVLVHPLAVDAASWRVLLDGLTGALTDVPPPAPDAPDDLADWVTELRELARDSSEAQHWNQVAERRARWTEALRDDAATVARYAESVPAGAIVTEAVPAEDVPPEAAVAEAAATGPAATGPAPMSRSAHHSHFLLDEDATERITHGLARRLALSAGQVLAGAFALALAQWQGSDDVGFDVRSDPRAGRQGLRRQVGRLTEPYPVQLMVTCGNPGLLDRLTALAGPLAACAGRAEGGAGFGACREWSPDPLLRRTLRELPPALACLTLQAPGEMLPDTARPLPGTVSAGPAHRVEVRVQLVDDRLRIALDWVPDAEAGITDASVADLARLLRELLEELAATPATPFPPAFRATPQQSALYTGGDAHPGTERHVEQLVWVWHGPLDTRRFTASWQSVFDCETILRTAFTRDAEPMLVVHDKVVPEVTRQILHEGDWSALLERDRLRGFDLHRPGALRLTLLETEQTEPVGAVVPTRILITYHRALLDTWSAHILLREFYSAYLAGGTLPGGERRPDLRDYTAWVAAQDLEPARGFWTRSAPPEPTAARPGRSTGLTGIGRARLRLDPLDTSRLTRWAGTWGTAESSVLQAVWAMLLYWSSGAEGPAPVAFAVTVSGRGIPLDGVARMPGPLRNHLPMSVQVDPAGTVPQLLRQLRDLALDIAAYEWVPADWIRTWGGGGGADTVIVFEDPPHPLDGLTAELAAHGIHAEFPGTLPARSVLPVGLLAHHDNAGGLVLTAVHDRAVLSEESAAEVLAQSALLLRALPLSAGEYTTVGEALKLLEDSAGPGRAEAATAGRDSALVTLRAARESEAGAICLVTPPGEPGSCYDLLAHTYPGPQELLVLTSDAESAWSDVAALGLDRTVLLAGFSGSGTSACEIARRVAAHGGRPPRVVLADAAADGWERARALADALRTATEPPA
ncbi:condensation domain-containing protein [Streptomyces sp. NPDC005017]|uniref:condensation domain-containing protein n=1 Tax=Streptomyces sp. NPDC005017 TaxID=3364706 RepID=UPI0036C9C6F6